MFYTEHPVGIFFMDGLARGFFNGQLSGWGTEPPILQPTAASVGAGQLPAGTYQFALTFVRDDGSESGTRRAGVVTATGAIAFSNIEVSADPNVVQKQIYVSSPDGETLYLSLILPSAATTATFSGGIIGATLETMFKTPPPNGSVLAEHNGRNLVGFGRWQHADDGFDHRRPVGVGGRRRFVDHTVKHPAAGVRGGAGLKASGRWTAAPARRWVESA